DNVMLSNYSCFSHSVHGIFCLSVQSFLGLTIGFDRLLAVSFPTKYNNLPMFIHALFILSSLTFASVITMFGLFDSNSTLIVPVCMPPTAFNFKSRLTWIGASFLLGILTLFVYITAHVKCAKLQ
ncbi:srsx-25, partial [Pristionchus pacificus]